MHLKAGEIGEVMHLARSGRLIVKLNRVGRGIRAGDVLVDRSGKRIGRVAELIGSVSAPYASLIPMTDRTTRLVGTKIFSGEVAKTSRTEGRDFRQSSRKG